MPLPDQGLASPVEGREHFLSQRLGRVLVVAAPSQPRSRRAAGVRREAPARLDIAHSGCTVDPIHPQEGLGVLSAPGIKPLRHAAIFVLGVVALALLAPSAAADTTAPLYAK
jgi:hypothetical protein